MNRCFAGDLEAPVVRSVVQEILQRPGTRRRKRLLVGERGFRRPLAVPPLSTPGETLLQMYVPLVASGPLRRHASRQLGDLPPGPPFQISHLQVQPLVRLIYVRLQLGLVPLQLGLHVPEERGTVAGVSHSYRALSDVASQVEIVLLATAQRIRWQGVQTRLGKRFRIGIVVTTVRRPLSTHHRLLEVDLVLLAERFVLLFLLLRAAIPAAAGTTTGLLSLLLVLAAALPVDLVHSRRRRILLAALAPRSALASRFTDYLQYLLQVLAPGNVLRGLPLLVPQATIAAGLQQDPRQLPTSHRRRDVQRCVAVLRLETIVSSPRSRLLIPSSVFTCVFFFFFFLF